MAKREEFRFLIYVCVYFEWPNIRAQKSPAEPSETTAKAYEQSKIPDSVGKNFKKNSNMTIIPKGNVTLGEIFDFVQSNVLKETAIMDSKQTPAVSAGNEIVDSWENWNIY